MSLTIAEDMCFTDIDEKLNKINIVLGELKLHEQECSVRNIVYQYLQEKITEICNDLHNLNKSVVNTNNNTKWTRERAEMFIHNIMYKYEFTKDDIVKSCYENGMRLLFQELFGVRFDE